MQGKSLLLPPAPPAPLYYPFPTGKSILGVIYGVLLWADMHAATPLRAWGRSVISLAVLLVCTVVLKPCQSALALLVEKQSYVFLLIRGSGHIKDAFTELSRILLPVNIEVARRDGDLV